MNEREKKKRKEEGKGKRRKMASRLVHGGVVQNVRGEGVARARVGVYG